MYVYGGKKGVGGNIMTYLAGIHAQAQEILNFYSAHRKGAFFKAIFLYFPRISSSSSRLVVAAGAEGPTDRREYCVKKTAAETIKAPSLLLLLYFSLSASSYLPPPVPFCLLLRPSPLFSFPSPERGEGGKPWYPELNSPPFANSVLTVLS